MFQLVPIIVSLVCGIGIELPIYRPMPNEVQGVANPVHSLNGQWLAQPEGDDATYPFEVPGQFLQQHIPFDETSPVMCTRTFIVDDDWIGNRIFIRFGSVFTDCTVSVNGIHLGAHLGSYTAFELDVTEAVHAGENTLELSVTSWSDADLLGSLSQYTAHPLGGIPRDVTLFTLPPVYVKECLIETTLDEQYEDGELIAQFVVENTTSQTVEDASLLTTLHALKIAEQTPLTLRPHESANIRVVLPAQSPNLWHAEHPNLYDFQCFLLSGNNETESFSKRVGFREIEVDGNRLLVNGVPVKLRGVNRHEVDPMKGRVVSDALCWRDAELFREANCNFIRTSHYPPSRAFLEACDELGLFVEVEAPVCWIGHGANKNWQTLQHDDPEWSPYIAIANIETIQYHRNHPSIIMWSLANESHWSENFANTLALVQHLDTSRPQLFHDQSYGGFNDHGSTATVANIHYPGPGGPAHVEATDFDRPMLFGEYCHLSVYNRRETLTDPAVRTQWEEALMPMWENMVKTNGVLGGALWSGIDDVFHLPDGTSVGYGPWGPIDGHRRRKPEFHSVKNVYSPIRFSDVQTNEDGSIEVAIENRLTVTNVNNLNMRAIVGDRLIRLDAPDIEAGESGTLRIPDVNGTSVHVQCIDNRGVMVAEAVLHAAKQGSLAAPMPLTTEALILENDDALVVEANGVLFDVDKTTGHFNSISKDNQTYVIGGPHLLAIPLVTDGCTPEHQLPRDPLTHICSNWTLTAIDVSEEGGSVTITTQGTYDESVGTITSTIHGDGTLAASYAFELLSETLVPRQLGIVFDVPRSLDTLTWSKESTWGHYPVSHINRPNGSAPAFYDDSIINSIEPASQWSHDATPLGCHDFRSTKANFYSYALKDASHKLVFEGDGTTHARSWIHGDNIRTLISTLNIPTGEMFIRGHIHGSVITLNKGSAIQGEVNLRFE